MSIPWYSPPAGSPAPGWTQAASSLAQLLCGRPSSYPLTRTRVEQPETEDSRLPSFCLRPTRLTVVPAFFSVITQHLNLGGSPMHSRCISVVLLCRGPERF